MKRKLPPPPLRPSSKLGVPDYSSSESLRAQCGEDVLGRRKSGPTVQSDIRAFGITGDGLDMWMRRMISLFFIFSE